jgi:hypothetical protein
MANPTREDHGAEVCPRPFWGTSNGRVGYQFHIAWQIWVLLAIAFTWPTTARAAETPSKKRPIIVATTLGIRVFHQELELDDDFAFGGRVGMGLSERWALLIDFVASHPHREATATASYVDALRLLVRANLQTGRFRPYVLGGPGGVLFMFNDTPSTAGGAATVGLGADYRVAPQTYVFVEGSMDLYSQQGITYLPDGSAFFAGPARARTLGTIAAGIGVEF